MAVGLYLSVPFCRTKCSYCNFASDVFSKQRIQAYVDRVCADMANARGLAQAAEAQFERQVDSIYLGGGTPSILAPAQLRQLFDSVRGAFSVHSDSEITVECAPGTLTPDTINVLVECGVNRVSLGVQSFVDLEARAVGRLHSAEITLRDIDALRSNGIGNLNLDLIAGLPHQTRDSWERSLRTAIECGVPHISVYMLEVDEDSRLGRELLAGGTRYHAHFVPDEDVIADLYVRACELLENAGIHQYEISNFSRPDFESRHNLKYWTRQPYIGFGVDAHSMLASASAELDAIRLAMPDSLETFLANVRLNDVEGRRIAVTPVTKQNAWEETFFLGLRLNRGVDLRAAEPTYGRQHAQVARRIAQQLIKSDFARLENEHLFLTGAGRLVSNEIFQMFLAPRKHGPSESVRAKLSAVSNTMQ